MKRVKFTLLPAALALAMALTLSCSGDDVPVVANDADDTNDVENGLPNKISGFAQKGPLFSFYVALHELDERLGGTGRSFKRTFQNDEGGFSLQYDEIASPYVMLEASGYYRNEVTGLLPKSPITLYAMVDVSEKDSANINVLTHLEHRRVSFLVEQGKGFAEAKKQAQKEILAEFGINGEFGNSEDMNIFRNNESAAVLLAVSVLLIGGLEEPVMLQILDDFIEEGSMWSGFGSLKDSVAVWAFGADFSNVKGFMKFGFGSDTPFFEKYVRMFWASHFGLGKCDASNKGEIKTIASLPSGELEAVCKNGSWRNPDAPPDKPVRLSYNYKEKYCSENECLYFTDSRDNQRYAYVVMGKQTWMAENLNYAAKGSKCRVDLENSCSIYGRLYNWATALTACPEGWHLPSKEEWSEIVQFVGNDYSTLKSPIGWSNDSWGDTGNGTDDYGFSVVPDGPSDGAGATFWTSSERNESRSYCMGIDISDGSGLFYPDKRYDYSIRCLMD